MHFIPPTPHPLSYFCILPVRVFPFPVIGIVHTHLECMFKSVDFMFKSVFYFMNNSFCVQLSTFILYNGFDANSLAQVPSILVVFVKDLEPDLNPELSLKQICGPKY